MNPPQEPRQDNTKHYRRTVGDSPQETGIDILTSTQAEHFKDRKVVNLDDGSYRHTIPTCDYCTKAAAQALLQLFEKEAVVLEVVVHLSPDTEFVKVIELSKLRELLGGAE